MPEGRQSPPPEQQSGRQQQDPPASGHGVNKTDDKDPKGQLDNLTSNPKGITEDVLKEKFSKTEKYLKNK